MNKLRLTALPALLIGLALPAMAGEVEELVATGNAAFRNEQYSEALEQYQIAETEIPESPELDYNIAGVLHHQEKFEEAVERFTDALNSQDANLHNWANYNLGSTYFRMGDYQNAIASFQKVLEADPSDLDAKFNLELARKKLKENIQPENEEQDEQQQQQQQEQEQQQQQQQQNQDQNEQDQQEQQEQQEQQQQQVEEKDISKEDAERILNALKDDEQDVQKKVKRQMSGGDYTGNDW